MPSTIAEVDKLFAAGAESVTLMRIELAYWSRMPRAGLRSAHVPLYTWPFCPAEA